MLWVLYSLISGFALATADALTKKVLHKVDDYVVMFSRLAFALPFVFVLLFFIEIPRLNNVFWYVVVIATPLEVAAWILYVKAIKVSPLSLTMPFLAFTPLFLILTSFLILNELPDISGVIGIISIVAGGYLLNVNTIKKGFLEPIKAILREKGSVYMIIAAFLFSILANLGKIAMQNSSPLFFAVFYVGLLMVVFFFIALAKSRKKLNQIKTHYKGLFWIGLFFGLMVIFNNLAILQTIVPYMISIKRTSIIFSVIYGYLLFKEKNIRERLIGTSFMFAGVVLITVF